MRPDLEVNHPTAGRVFTRWQLELYMARFWGYLLPFKSIKPDIEIQESETLLSWKSMHFYPETWRSMAASKHYTCTLWEIRHPFYKKYQNTKQACQALHLTINRKRLNLSITFEEYSKVTLCLFTNLRPFLLRIPQMLRLRSPHRPPYCTGTSCRPNPTTMTPLHMAPWPVGLSLVDCLAQAESPDSINLGRT